MILGLELCWFRLGHWRQTGAGIEAAVEGRREIRLKKKYEVEEEGDRLKEGGEEGERDEVRLLS